MNRIMMLILPLVLIGCGKTAPTAPSTENAAEHAHEAGGPHGGAILELGENHAELVHDDATGTVTVYILDGAAAANVPVVATEAVINITHDGQGEQFKLAASPLAGEPAGQSSRFVSLDSDLSEDLDDEDAAAVFVITIDGQQHRGAIEHHDDGDHDHTHETDRDHDHE